jgi:hypothetical protein
MSERISKIFLAVILLISTADASELTHEFKNPSFSGQGYSNHVLAIEQLRYQREKEIQEKKEAQAAKLARELEQTTLNKFINNVESRIYANCPSRWWTICSQTAAPHQAQQPSKVLPYTG